MIVGACHSTSALVINPCTIANSFGAGYRTLHASRAGAGKALLRASCSKGSADSRSQPYGDPALVNRGPARTGPSERRTWRSIAAPSCARRLSIGLVRPKQVAHSITPPLEQNGGGLPVAERASGYQPGDPNNEI